MNLQDKNILLGVTGGIAAYKAAELTRLLIKAGAKVKIVMTRGATAFITPMTLQALSGEPVRETLFSVEHEAGMGHIELARWADAVLIAPATAQCMAQISHGFAGDLLTTLCLATTAPIAIAPAMNQQMWQHHTTQANLHTLTNNGVLIMGPGDGSQACGEIGPGRMLEPEHIIEQLPKVWCQPLLANTNVLINAGPTRETIDPIRYISNRSSGKMGYALAQAARNLGANVTLISGPTHLNSPTAIQFLSIESAQQMHDTVIEHATKNDIFISCAAVADFTPLHVETHKIKKANRDVLQLELSSTTDILAAVSQLEQRPFCVGFAAETDDLIKHATAKLTRKKLNMIAANQLSDTTGMAHDQNALEVIWADGSQSLPRAAKITLAYQLLELVAAQYHQK